MHRIVPRLCLLAVLLTSCSTPATTISSPTATIALEPTVTSSPSARPFIILAYATAGIDADTIPYEKLTHINYSFLIPNPDGSFNPIENSSKLKQIIQAAHGHNVKVCISVGGWGWDAQFEELAAKAESRTAFVQNLNAFVDEYQLDGADIDWEYPDPGPSSGNFLALIQELRAAMPEKLLTTAVVSYGDEYGSGIPSQSFELFDFVNIMTYDGPDHGTMEQFEKGLSYWRTRGLPREKTVMGVPFYARPEMPYFKIVRADPNAAQGDSFEQDGTTYHYNGIPTVQAKTRIAMEKASGILFWALDHDAQTELSLVEAIYETAISTP
jgi:GH18 family chitinase